MVGLSNKVRVYMVHNLPQFTMVCTSPDATDSAHQEDGLIADIQLFINRMKQQQRGHEADSYTNDLVRISGMTVAGVRALLLNKLWNQVSCAVEYAECC